MKSIRIIFVIILNIYLGTTIAQDRVCQCNLFGDKIDTLCTIDVDTGWYKMACEQMSNNSAFCDTPYTGTTNHSTLEDSEANKWEISPVLKTWKDSAISVWYSRTITNIDTTIGAYTNNDTSIFFVHHWNSTACFYTSEIDFEMLLDVDSGDYGLIEYRKNGDSTWTFAAKLDYKQNTIKDASGLLYWSKSRITFNGNNDNLPWLDSVTYKFTFISDSISSNRKGWAIANLWIHKKTVPISNDDYKVYILNVYPNPTTGVFRIESDKTEIYNVSGQRILTSTRQAIDLTGYPKGLYFIKAQKGDQVYYSKVVLE